MLCGQILQRIKHTVDEQHIAVLSHNRRNFVHCLDHKTAHTTLIERVDISLSATVLCSGQGKEQCLGRQYERARVGEQLAHISLRGIELCAMHTHHFRDFFDAIFH